MTDTTDIQPTEWQQTACILCECNCGVEIRLGADERTFERVRGDKAHPASKGYTCEKALRLDYYQNGRGERLLSPLRRRADGTYEEIDWDTALTEVAERLAAVRDTYGGESIVYYGGGGQGNHLGGVYGAATLGALGVRYRSNAIAQEKTGGCRPRSRRGSTLRMRGCRLWAAGRAASETPAARTKVHGIRQHWTGRAGHGGRHGLLPSSGPTGRTGLHGPNARGETWHRTDPATRRVEGHQRYAHRVALIHGTKKDAKRLAAAQMAVRPSKRAGGCKVAQLLDDWIETRAPTWAPLTLRDHESRAAHIQDDLIARSSVVSLSVSEIDRWVARMRKAGALGAAKEVNQFAALAFRLAADARAGEPRPHRLVVVPSPGRDPRRRRRSRRAI